MQMYFQRELTHVGVFLNEKEQKQIEEEQFSKD